MPTLKRTKPAHPGAAALVTLLLLVAVAAFVLGNRVFIVRSIAVEGNRLCTAEEVIRASGIARGDSMLTLNTGKIRAGIDANRYLSFVGLWRDFPDRVILTVQEVSPHAVLYRAGMTVLLGPNGLVLEETSQIDMELPVPVVTGLEVEAVRVGQPIALGIAGQLETLLALLDALEGQGIASDVSELNVAALDNLYLVTEEGLQVMLGGEDLLPEKIALLTSMLIKLPTVTDTVRGGVLDLSTGVSADFQRPRKN